MHDQLDVEGKGKKIGFKEVSSKGQIKLLDEVMDSLNLDKDDEKCNGVKFYRFKGEIVLRRLDID